jgi:hypothetical protein
MSMSMRDDQCIESSRTEVVIPREPLVIKGSPSSFARVLNDVLGSRAREVLRYGGLAEDHRSSAVYHHHT